MTVTKKNKTLKIVKRSSFCNLMKYNKMVLQRPCPWGATFQDDGKVKIKMAPYYTIIVV